MKKIISLLTAVIAVAVSAYFLAACDVTPNPPKPEPQPETLTVTPTEATVYVGAKLTLVALSSGGYDIDWESDNVSVAEVDQSGVVTGIGEGSAVITATDGVLTASCAVTVEKAQDVITLSSGSITLTKGESATLTAESSFGLDITWRSADPAIVEVDDSGKVTGVSVGSTAIIAEDGVTYASCAVTVTYAPNPPPAPDDNPPTDPRFIRAVGDKLRLSGGTGDVITLRGVNAGGVFVTEDWMNAFTEGQSYRLSSGKTVTTDDNKGINEIFADRFGEQKTVDLWNAYRSAYWSDIDFANCAAMGINVIRLPFTYMTVDPDYHEVARKSGQKYNFDLLDDFVNKADEFGIYTILDLHGAYGSQNGKDHSGEILGSRAEVTFYEEAGAANRQKTAELWSAIAEHYKGNPAVAGYDLLNEPGERTDDNGVESTTTRHWKVLDEFYDAVREKDADHVVIIESCWGGGDLPAPSVYGWENVMYSFHHYTNNWQNDDGAYNAHISSMRDRVNEVESRNFGVPLYMGEFTGYDNQRSWRDTLELFNEHGWSWTSWCYKITPSYNNSWGVYLRVCRDSEFVNAATDSYDAILQKFSALKTTWEGYPGTPTDFSNPSEYRQYSFRSSYINGGWSNGKHLAEIIYDYARA